MIAADWPNAPGLADRFHVETHLVEGRDVFRALGYSDADVAAFLLRRPRRREAT